MPPPLAIDLTGLALAPISRTPRGIDRVELAYARHFLKNWPAQCDAVLPTPWGVRLYERERALDGLTAVETLWRETLDPLQDAVYLQTKSAILGGGNAARAGGNSRLSLAEKIRRFRNLLSATGFSFGRPVGSLPAGAIYLNVGQLAVFRPLLAWLRRRPDVIGIFMIHDVGPIEYPRHHIPVVVRSHKAIVRNTAEVAKALIVPSEAARESIQREVAQYRSGGLPVHVELLPVPSEFLGPADKDAELAQTRYFIVCGAIEPHKNHKLLLDVWDELAARHGANIPKLVIAGSPYISTGPAYRAIENAAANNGHVIVARGLSTPSLRRLVMSARALLAPSIAEGFGLPIVEALAQGTPVIASDIPGHREAGRGGDVAYLSPTDKAGWLARVEALSDAAANVSPETYKAKTWNKYFYLVEAFLLDLTSRREPDARLSGLHR